MIQFVVKVHKFLFVYSNLVSTNREREKQNMISKNIILHRTRTCLVSACRC